METLNEFLGNITNGASGFSLGEPYRPRSDSIVAIVPITRQIRRQRDYITLSEAGERVSIKDTGRIDEVIVTNNTEKPIFIPAAWMLSGETQTRIVTQSVVVLAGEAYKISVACVQRSRGISRDAILSTSGAAPRSVERVLHQRSVQGNIQDELWDSVEKLREKLAPGDETDNLMDIHDRHKRAEETILRQLPEVLDQVGFFILVQKGVSSVECLDLPDSWRVIGNSLIEKDVEAISQTKGDFDSIFEYKPQQAYSVLRALLQRQFVVETIISGPNWETMSISAIDYAGEATIMDGTIIHVSLGRKEY